MKRLSSTITLRDGRKVVTLAEAVSLLSELPERRQRHPVWEKAMEMLLQASESGKAIDMRHATAQLVRALQVEGWIV